MLALFDTLRSAPAWIASLAAGLVVFAHAAPSQAQESAAPDEHLVVLDPPGGGGAHLREELRGVGEYEIQGQTWFLEQVDEQRLDPKGLINRPDELTLLMNEARIAYILYSVPEDGHYQVRLVSREEGKEVFSTVVDRPEGRLTRPGARLVRFEVASHLGLSEGPDESPGGAAEPSGRAEDETGAPGQRHLLWTSAKFRLFKRDLTFAGTASNQKGVLTYRSFFYPGFEVTSEIYPLAQSHPDAASMGAFVEFDHGFDGGKLPTSDGESESFTLQHTSFQIGPIVRLDQNDEEPSGGIRRRIRFGAFVRYEVYATSSETPLPTLSTTSLLAGGRITYPVFGEDVALQSRFDIAPVAFFGKGGDTFGNKSGTVGFGGRLGALYAITDAIRATAGYRMRLNHSRFRGDGDGNFAGSEGFELVQGLDIGVQYRY